MAANNSHNNWVGPPCPGPIANNWYNGPFWMGGCGGSPGTRSIATGTLYFVPFFVYKTTTFLKIGLFCSSTGAGTVNMGVYNDSGRSKPIGSPITNSQSGNVTMVTTSFISFTFSTPITLKAGMYWLAFSVSATNTISGPTGGGYEAGIARGLGDDATPGVSMTDVALQGGWSQTFTYNATLPAVGTLAVYKALAGGDIYFWMQAQ